LLAFLVLQTGLWGIPENLAEEFAFLVFLNEHGYLRALVSVVFVALLVAAVIGPARLRQWRSSASDWLHASARQIQELEEKNTQLKQDKRFLEERVRTLENHIATTPRTEAQQLKHDCRQLAAELHVFIRTCKEEREALSLKAQSAKTEEEKQQALQALSDTKSKSGNSISGYYTLLYRNRAATLLKTAVELGWIEPNEMLFADVAAQSVSLEPMEYVAQILERIGQRS
jgi:septal ring factor EnvC (AmiA/AmiB activator)